MFIHIHKGGEINPAMWHLEPCTSVSVIKFSTITSAKVITIQWQMVILFTRKAFWEDLTSTSQEHLLWVSRNRNQRAGWFLILGIQCSSSWKRAHWEITLHGFFPAFSFCFWAFLWKYRCRTYNLIQPCRHTNTMATAWKVFIWRASTRVERRKRKVLKSLTDLATGWTL